MNEENLMGLKKDELLIATEDIYPEDGGFNPRPARAIAKGQLVAFWSYETNLGAGLQEICVSNLSGSGVFFIYTHQVRKLFEN